MKYKSSIDNLIVHKVGRFEKGIFEANNKKHVAILDIVPECFRADGSMPEDALIEDAPIEDALIEEMSVKQLRSYAKENKIKIPAKLSAKNDILKFVLGA